MPQLVARATQRTSAQMYEWPAVLYTSFHNRQREMSAIQLEAVYGEDSVP